MNEQYLPIRYRVEFYDPSSADDPIFTFRSTSAPPFAVGDLVNPQQWPIPPAPSIQYKIRALAHRISVDSEGIVDLLTVFVTPAHPTEKTD